MVKYIIASIETIYLNIKTVPRKVNIIYLLFFVLAMLIQALEWNLFFNIAFSRQNTYCYDPFSRTLEICPSYKICSTNTNQFLILYVEKTDNITIIGSNNISINYSHKIYSKDR